MIIILTLWPVPVLFLPDCVSLQPSSAGNHGRDLAEKRIVFPVGERRECDSGLILLSQDLSNFM